MTFSQFLERVAWGAMAGVIFYAASKLEEMSRSVNQLNGSMLVVIEKAKIQESDQKEVKVILKEHDQRIDQLEKNHR